MKNAFHSLKVDIITGVRSFNGQDKLDYRLIPSIFSALAVGDPHHHILKPYINSYFFQKEKNNSAIKLKTIYFCEQNTMYKDYVLYSLTFAHRKGLT